MLDKILAGLPDRYPGPGGAVAVLRRGETLARHTWGWADAEARLAFTPATPFLMCSITKQFTCALLLDRFADPTVLDDDLGRVMPDLAQAPPGVLDLCHNQSGLRDYWALAMLCGAAVEGEFGDADARTLIDRTRTLQFEPGTRYSYANQNFRIVSDMLERRLDRPFGDLLRAHLFDRAGMAHARLNPRTSRVAGGTIGYEGTVESGFRPAVNRIEWTGDAGLAASLDDMIAWERHIDATRDDPDSLYGRLARPTSFRNGEAAAYGFGLSRARLLGHAATSHGGALRGWRSFRANLPEQRLSVVVMFNHMADARAAALELLAGLVTPADAAPPSPDVRPGRYIEPDTDLAVRIEADGRSPPKLLYTTHPETLDASTTTRLRPQPDGLWMDRVAEGQSTRLTPAVLTGQAGRDVEGQFHCRELGSDFTCTMAGGVPYGAFSGFLGAGAMLALQPFSDDTWLLPCPRALDHSPPGDWTLRFRSDRSGVRIGCWLARGLEFERT